MKTSRVLSAIFFWAGGTLFIISTHPPSFGSGLALYAVGVVSALIAGLALGSG